LPGRGCDHIITAVQSCFCGEYNIRTLKEKYGSLRIDVEPVDAYSYGLSDLAEQISEVTCESCGNLGIMRQVRGWYKVRCDACFKDEETVNKCLE
jgi:hypothetical protein